MNVTQLIALIRSNIARLRSENAELVTIASLETLLATVENHVAQQPDDPMVAIAIENAKLQHEHAKLQHASNLAQYEARNASARELFKSVITTAGVAIKSLILINGGAAVALLAFIGHLATSETNQHAAPVHAFAFPLLWFVIGVWTAALFAGFVAAAQKLYSEAYDRAVKNDAQAAQRGRRLQRCANACVVVVIVCGLCSLAAFARGSYLAYVAFATM
jgi:hypothetical protein